MTDDRRKGDRRMPPAVADFALQQLAATPMTVQDFTHDAENYGPALNDACWTFTHECPETSALLFNNTKAPLRAAILKYAELVKPTTAENYELLQAKVDEQAREIVLVRDALDHIARTCTQSRTQTRRLRWINYRANTALEGKPYDPKLLDIPVDGEQQAIKAELKLKALQSELAALKAQPTGVVLPERDAIISNAVGMCNRIPGSTTWNAAEYAYDEIVARLNSSPVSAGCVVGGNGISASMRGALAEAAASCRVDERAAFESAMGASILAEQGKFSLSRSYDAGRPYTFLATKWAWASWQARAALSANHSEQVLASDLAFLAEYILGREYGRALPNYEALGRYPLDVAEQYRAAPSAGSQKEQE